MDKIEELTTTTDMDQYGNVYGYNYPSRKEIMDKINEIIRSVNKIIGIMSTPDNAAPY